MVRKKLLQYNDVPVVDISGTNQIFVTREKVPTYKAPNEKEREEYLPYFGKLLSRYFIYDGIGTGGYADVFIAYDLIFDQWVALKIFTDGRDLEPYDTEKGIYEILSAYPKCDSNLLCMYNYGFFTPSRHQITDVLREKYESFLLNHKELPEMQYIPKSHPFIVTELMDVDLYGWYYLMSEELGTRNWMDKYQTVWLYVLKEVLKGLLSIHNKGLTHNDLKPENILIKILDERNFFRSLSKKGSKGSINAIPLEQYLVVKIGDFGAACTENMDLMQEYQIPMCSGIHTFETIPPEYLNYILIHSDQSESDSFFKYPLDLQRKADLWSYGLLLFEGLYFKDYQKLTSLANKGHDSNKDAQKFETYVEKTLPKLLTNTKKRSFQIPPKWSAVLYELLRVDPQYRPEAKEALAFLESS